MGKNIVLWEASTELEWENNIVVWVARAEFE